MIATNHALTGALIGLTVASPVIAVPLAVLSHFICDAIPHYGGADGEAGLKSKGFAVRLLIDAALCGFVVLALVTGQPANWLLAAVCAFTAAAPDFAWMPRYIRAIRGRASSKVTNPFTIFAAKIQWFEKPIGAVVEAAWMIAGVTLLVAYL